MVKRRRDNALHSFRIDRDLTWNAVPARPFYRKLAQYGITPRGDCGWKAPPFLSPSRNAGSAHGKGRPEGFLMPELPEIANLARQMDQELRGRRVSSVEIRQPKCLNLPPEDFRRLLIGKTFAEAGFRGKWVLARLITDAPGVKPAAPQPGTEARFLLSLGMGGDAFFHHPGASLPDQYQIRMDFTDASSFTIRFWWFGYAHAATPETLGLHKMTADLGLNPLDDREFSFDAFAGALEGKRGGVKSFLMDQRNVAGIGNVYIQDILFLARLHPNRRVPTLTETEKKSLHGAIRQVLAESTGMGGLKYEKDLYAQNGRWDTTRVGYREGKPCPICGTTIEKIRTGGTSSFICPSCQEP